MIELAIRVFLSYLVGSVVGSLVVGRLRGGVDIRKLGSGNAGGTNALRTQGKSFALWVMIIDIGKGWLAPAAIAVMALPAVAPATPDIRAWMPSTCGAAAILGHVYPVWHGFRGGKGVATLVGAVVGLGPVFLLPMVLTWSVAVMLLGFVSVASILAAISFPVYVACTDAEPTTALLTFGLVTAALIIFTHRSNIARLQAGTEPRARRLWLFGRGGQ